jgi:hypothetical protein
VVISLLGVFVSAAIAIAVLTLSFLVHMYYLRIDTLYFGIRGCFGGPFCGASEALAWALHVALQCGGACHEVFTYCMCVQIWGSFQKFCFDGFEEG